MHTYNSKICSYALLQIIISAFTSSEVHVSSGPDVVQPDSPVVNSLGLLVFSAFPTGNSLGLQRIQCALQSKTYPPCQGLIVARCELATCSTCCSSSWTGNDAHQPDRVVLQLPSSSCSPPQSHCSRVVGSIIERELCHLFYFLH